MSLLIAQEHLSWIHLSLFYKCCWISCCSCLSCSQTCLTNMHLLQLHIAKDVRRGSEDVRFLADIVGHSVDFDDLWGILLCQRSSLQMPQSACLLNCWTVNCFVFHSKSLLQSEVCNKNNMLSCVNNLFLQTLLRCVELMAHSEENMHDKSTHILSHTVVSLINRPIIKGNYSFCASTQAFKANS